MNSAYKLNTMAILKHHKKNCDGKDCNVSLITLMMMAEEAGVKFTQKQKEKFF